MRNNLKHLFLGMSLGAVVVFIYGINKLTPFAEKQTQFPQNTVSIKVKQVSTEELLKPKIADSVNVNLNTEVQFLEIKKLYPKNFEKVKVDSIQTKSDNKLAQDTNKTEETKANDIAKKLIRPEVAFYIYKNNNTQDQPTILDPLQLPLALEEGAETPTPTLEPTPIPKQDVAYTSATNVSLKTQSQNIGAPENIIALIEKYAQEFGVDKNMMIGIAKCESGFRENAVNGPYAGIYQFVSGTWISNRRAMGLDENIALRYNAEESIRTAAFKMSRDGFGAWPVCQYKAQKLLATDMISL